MIRVHRISQQHGALTYDRQCDQLIDAREFVMEMINRNPKLANEIFIASKDNGKVFTIHDERK